jgi:DNA-binding CsgD family transcriptional regulator
MPEKPATTRSNADVEACCALAAALLELYSAADVADLQQTAVRVLRRLLPCAFASVHELAGGSKLVRHVCEPSRFAGRSKRLRVPAFSATSGSRPEITNVPPVANDPSAASGDVDDVLLVAVQPTPSTRLIFMVARMDGSFTEPDRAIAAALRPHFLRAYELAVLLRQRRNRAGGEPGPAAASTLLRRRFGLTDRESELLYWLARGKSNREMGIIFSISARTVDKHLQHVFDKMDVENRHAAVVQALQAIGSA